MVLAVSDALSSTLSSSSHFVSFAARDLGEICLSEGMTRDAQET